MTRNDHFLPFDQETHERRGDDLTEEFWGTSPGWRGRSATPDRSRRPDDTTGSMRAIRDGVAAFRPHHVDLRDATGQVQRTRHHGAPQPQRIPAVVERPEATLGQLASGHVPQPHVDAHVEEIPLEPVRRSVVGFDAIDPLLVRFGVLLLVGAMLVPLALSLRPGGEAEGSVSIEAPSPAFGAPVADGTAAASTNQASAPAGSPAGDGGSATASDATSAATVSGQNSAGAASTSTAGSDPVSSETPVESAPDQSVGNVTESVSTGLSDAATADAPAERVVPACPQTYTAAAGDSWYRIADAAGVAPSDVLGQNNATIDTVILPGDEICLPADATVPSPPTATPSTPTTNAPTTTDTPATTTTVATTVSGSPGRDATEAEIKDVIRSVFPESEWETAFDIVQRESRFEPTAYNGWCCYGLFQIYWSVHERWLDDIGVDSASDLYDPLLNVRAAHRLWERAGNSWSPWSTYGG